MSKYLVQASWDDVPHLTAQAKKELWASIPVHQQEARSKGVPELGSGAIYPILSDDFTVPDFKLPRDWRYVYGMDVGWNFTAFVFGAYNPVSDTIYLWHCYKRGQAEPSVHAQAVKGQNNELWPWMNGVVDPASRGRSQIDGRKLINVYQAEGLNIHMADNAVEAGIGGVWGRLATGRLRVFKSMAPWLAEYSNYHRDKNGNVVKVNDHLMDATRYLVMSGLPHAQVWPVTQDRAVAVPMLEYVTPDSDELGWMG